MNSEAEKKCEANFCRSTQNRFLKVFSFFSFIFGFQVDLKTFTERQSEWVREREKFIISQQESIICIRMNSTEYFSSLLKKPEKEEKKNTKSLSLPSSYFLATMNHESAPIIDTTSPFMCKITSFQWLTKLKQAQRNPIPKRFQSLHKLVHVLCNFTYPPFHVLSLFQLRRKTFLLA